MINEYTHVENILKDLKAIIEREDKRHQMDEHLTTSMRMLLEDEIIPQLENELETSIQHLNTFGITLVVNLPSLSMRCTPLRTTASTTHEQHSQWQRYSPEGSRVPTDPTACHAIRYETARAVIFEQQGNFVRANDCLRL